MTKNGTTGISRSVNRYNAPSFSTPSLIDLSGWPNLCCTQSRSKNRDARKASVAPREEANETMTVPHPRPKIAPAASVMIVAPGSERLVTAT